MPEESQELILTAQRLPLCFHWCIVMAAGGHFAIALFERDKIIQHKTFHKYIIRAKQGSAQSAHDQKTGGKAKSAGANLRRQNMLHLKQVRCITADRRYSSNGLNRKSKSCSSVGRARFNAVRSSLFERRASINNFYSATRTHPWPVRIQGSA